MRVETTYWIEGFKTLKFDVSSENITEYIKWCKHHNKNINDSHNLLDYLNGYVAFDEDVDIDSSGLSYVIGIDEILNKCLEITNDHK